MLASHFPRLAPRISAISNCVDPNFFLASPRRPDLPDRIWNHEKDWLAISGQIAPWKNLHGLVDALLVFNKTHGVPPRIRWAGRVSEGLADYVQVHMARLRKATLETRLELVGDVPEIGNFLAKSSGLLHPSLREGYPNAVCEAFAVGLPAVIGDVSDAKLLIGEDRGFLCDPTSPSSISDALFRYVSLSLEARKQMGNHAIAFAKQEFQISAVAQKYAELFAN